MGYRLVSMAANSVHYKEIKLKPNKNLTFKLQPSPITLFQLQVFFRFFLDF